MACSFGSDYHLCMSWPSSLIRDYHMAGKTGEVALLTGWTMEMQQVLANVITLAGSGTHVCTENWF